MAGLKFRILLDSISQTEVLREIIINDNQTFESFYNAILSSFQLENNQMASFYVSDEEWDKGEEITLMDMSFDGEENSPIEMNTVDLKERLFSPTQRYILVYDFLSMWIFLIELNEIIDDFEGDSEVVFSVGEIPEKLKKSGPKPMDEINFETEIDISQQTDKNGYDDDFDDLGDFDFENIDDYDF